jgi:hypothetical protein
VLRLLADHTHQVSGDLLAGLGWSLVREELHDASKQWGSMGTSPSPILYPQRRKYNPLHGAPLLLLVLLVVEVLASASSWQTSACRQVRLREGEKGVWAEVAEVLRMWFLLRLQLFQKAAEGVLPLGRRGAQGGTAPTRLRSHVTGRTRDVPCVGCVHCMLPGKSTRGRSPLLLGLHPSEPRLAGALCLQISLAVICSGHGLRQWYSR